jgi:hypothetical protein
MLIVGAQAEKERRGRWLFHCPICEARNNQVYIDKEEDLMSSRVFTCNKCHRQLRIAAPREMKGIILCN